MKSSAYVLKTAGVRRSRKEGVTTTETVLVVGLIAVAAIAALMFFGGTIKESFKNMGNRINGKQTASTTTVTDSAVKINGTGTQAGKWD